MTARWTNICIDDAGSSVNDARLFTTMLSGLSRLATINREVASEKEHAAFMQALDIVVAEAIEALDDCLHSADSALADHRGDGQA